MGEALRLLRIFNGYKMSELAQKMGISQSYISELENNKKQPSLEILEKYASIFGMKKSTLMLFAESLEEDTSMKNRQQKVAYAGMKLLKIIEKVGSLDIE